MNINRDSFILGIKIVAPILASDILFGLIFGLTGGLSGLSVVLIASMSVIIFAGSAQIIVLVLIINHQPLLAMIVAGILINLRHLLYGANLHADVSTKGLKRVLIAYFLVDEAFISATIAKKQYLHSDLASSPTFIEDILLGSGSTVWLFWNLATIAGYLLTNFITGIVTISANFVVAGTFLGYLVLQWRGSTSSLDKQLMLLLIVMTFIFSFVLQNSILLITILLCGIVLGILLNYQTTFNNSLGKKQQIFENSE